jgi:hypothetical protein
LEEIISALNKKVAKQEVIKKQQNDIDRITEINIAFQVFRQTENVRFKLKNISGCHENGICFSSYTCCCEYKWGM